MSELGRFLELFYSPQEQFQSVMAHGLHQKFSPSSKTGAARRSIGRPRVDKKPTDPIKERLSMWAVLPDRVRVEVARDRDGVQENTVEVVNEQCSWHRHPDGTVEIDSREERNNGRMRDLPTEFQRHFDSSLMRQIFAALTLEQIGETNIANRDCVVIRAAIIPTGRLWPHWLSADATEFEFVADLEQPVLLAIYAKIEDQIVESHEVLEVEFDPILEESLFSYEPAPTERMQAAVPVTETITLVAAVERASFAVLYPTYLPEAERINVEVMYHAERPSRKVESLTIFFRGPKTFRRLWIIQCSTDHANSNDEFEWQEIHNDGMKMKFSDPECDDGLSVLCRESEGTLVLIYSDLPKTEMVRIAASLKRYKE